MNTGHTGTGLLLALDVQTARRSSGLTMASLAERAGVDEATIRHVEGGESVPSEAALAVCHVLGIPPTRHLPDPAGMRDVTTFTQTQTDVMRVLLNLPDAGVHLVVSDVAAEDAATGRNATTWAEDQRLAERRREFYHWSVIMELTSASGITSFAMVIVMSLIDLIRFEAWNIVPKGDAWGHCMVIMLTSAAATAGAMYFRKSYRLGRDPETERLLTIRGTPDLRDLALHQGYVISPAGLSVVEVRDGVVTRTDMPVETMSGVTLAEHGTSHVGVIVTTAMGRCTLSWIPRTHDVVDVVQGWHAAVASRTEPGVPYRLEIPGVPLLEGAQ